MVVCIYSMKVLFMEYCSTVLVKVSDVAKIDNVVLSEGLKLFYFIALSKVTLW